MTTSKSLIIFTVVLLMGLAVAWAGSQNSVVALGVPLFGLIVGLAFIIQWLLFIPAYLKQTEKFFDLSGSLTFITLSLVGLFLAPALPGRSLLIAGLTIVWAARLGTFLFRRIQRDGKDGRFDAIKPKFFRFLNAWSIQGLWVTITAAGVFITLTTKEPVALGGWAVLGSLVWLIGFTVEVVADRQKSAFRAVPANQGKFINSGLWARSRHPNYFGEILLWVGITLIALPTFQGWQWVGLFSPVFVALLLTRVSGVNMLEARAEKKWGGQADYEAYKKNTPVLVPRIFK